MSNKALVFTDLNSKEEWIHDIEDWILNYITVQSPIQPNQLKPGQEITIKDTFGNPVKIKCLFKKDLKEPEVEL